MLIKYVRTKDKKPVGVVLALGREEIGWSLCNKKDKWNREKGLKIAFNRAEKGFHRHIPFSIKEEFKAMEVRASKYYDFY